MNNILNVWHQGLTHNALELLKIKEEQENWELLSIFTTRPF